MVDKELTCWGCGLRLLPPTQDAPALKCGWCGAIAYHNVTKPRSQYRRLRRFRDLCFASILFGFMLFIICGGVWAVFPIIFPICCMSAIIHSIITIILAVTTISTFGLSAFRCAGAPPTISWGSYPDVGKGELENYTFCSYCSKPKPPRAHHCRSCGICIMDMDHHCPFIGNCVGAANHRYFIAFLVSAIFSNIYVSVMSAYTSFYIWPSFELRPLLIFTTMSNDVARWAIGELILALLSTAMELCSRGLLLVYLFVASVSVEITLSVLLWQQLWYIYEGRTYIAHLTSRDDNPVNQKDCQNLLNFFGCQHSRLRFLPRFRNPQKKHKK